MPEPAILHRCPHCNRVFDSPSICMESGEQTVPEPQMVPKQWMRAALSGDPGPTQEKA